MSTPDNENEKLSYKPRDIWARFGWVEKIGVFVVALLVAYVFYIGMISPVAGSYEDGGGIESAEAACQMAVEDRASHLDGRKVHPQNRAEIGDDKYRASGEVTWNGQKSSYSCTVELDSDTDEWVVQVTGEPKF